MSTITTKDGTEIYTLFLLDFGQHHRFAVMASRNGKKVLGINFSTPIVLYVPRPHVGLQRQACPRAARKSGIYRSLRSLQVAAQVPSAGTIILHRVAFGADADSTRAGASARCLKRAPHSTSNPR